MDTGRDPGLNLERLVVLAKSAKPDYGALASPVEAPELPAGVVRTVPQAAVRELLRSWGLDAERFGTPAWNPLTALIPEGARVTLKPNWVLHWNRSGSGLDCLITHPAVIEAVLDYVALARPSRVVLGDAPVQGCDFEALRKACGLDEMVERFRRRGLDVEICDFRRTVLPGGRLGGKRIENRRAMEHFVLFDLKKDSLLEALAKDAEKFRVTVYNPDLLNRTHAPGRHQYLVAREVIEADVVINLPKLKCHKKACVTGALKNLVGINGHKEYLPHHRKGGSGTGGDCYEGRSWLKYQAEELYDWANRCPPGTRQALLARMGRLFARTAHLLGSDLNLEGSWYGNDTVWRTCLDLQRILRYGRPDGTLAETVQRQVISVTDTIIGGEGEGPMASTPVPAGFLTGATNPAAAEWVHARLMGFDPNKIPLVREAFGSFSYPLVSFAPSEICVRTEEGELEPRQVFPFVRAFRPAAGWLSHCELDEIHDRELGKPNLVA